MDSKVQSKQENRVPWTLEGELCRRIRARGSIAFSDYMATALYHPDGGYYTSGRNPWGVGGDYLTVPQVHPALGMAVARLAAELDRTLGHPDPFTLVELGSGDGRLLAATAASLNRAHPETYSRLRVVSAELGGRGRHRQRERLPSPPRGLELIENATCLPPGLGIRGMVYSNELLDAFPVERLTMRSGRLLQSHVTLDGQRLVERFVPVTSADIHEHLRFNAIRLQQHQVAEICLEVAPWVRAVARSIEQGALLTVDYGHETEALYGPSRLSGTLVCHHRYQLSDDPLRRPGEQDITAHVDFGNLRRLGHEHGLDDVELCSLRVFLIGMGMAQTQEGGLRERLRLRHLLVSEIGDTHKVLLQTKGLPAGSLRFGRARLAAETETRA